MATLGLLRCTQASQCSGFSCRGPRALSVRASVVVAHRLSCSRHVGSSPTRDQTCVPPLASRFSTTGPPGSPSSECITCVVRRHRKGEEGLPEVTTWCRKQERRLLCLFHAGSHHHTISLKRLYFKPRSGF